MISYETWVFHYSIVLHDMYEMLLNNLYKLDGNQKQHSSELWEHFTTFLYQTSPKNIEPFLPGMSRPWVSSLMILSWNKFQQLKQKLK